jgi:precorrin-2 dehydrogenase/sirohydrochlorin ferrochelatase
MGYFPVMLDMSGKSVAIVGSLSAVRPKVDRLIAAGACINVFDDYDDGEGPVWESAQVFVHHRLPNAEDLVTCTLIIAAHSDADVNQDIRLLAQQVRVFVNVVDRRDESDCIMVSQLRRGDLVIGVSTSGIAPGLARRIRLELESLFDNGWAERLKRFGVLRSQILAIPDLGMRRTMLTQAEEHVMASWARRRRNE